MSEFKDEHVIKQYFTYVKPFQALEIKQRIFHVILNIQ